MNYYVFRIDYGSGFDKVYGELKEGRLRQGWGWPGMSVADYPSFESFREAYGESTRSENYIKVKFSSLGLLPKMKEGEIIVIPKVSMEDPGDRQSFTLARCSGAYSFEVLDGDYGHIVPVEVVASIPYDNPDAGPVARVLKSRGYSRCVQRILKEEVKGAIDALLHKHAEDPESVRRVSPSATAAIKEVTGGSRQAYLRSMVEAIRHQPWRTLEKLIVELFDKNGYAHLDTHVYDRREGDIDLVFAPYPADSLMGAVCAMGGGDVGIPEIRVQAKMKWGIDGNDIKGVRQLLTSEGAERCINILVNMADDFTEAARESAGRDVILLNGMQFAELLAGYGLDPAEE